MTDRNEPAEAGTTSYLRRSSELLWGSPARPARGPKPGLTLERIVDVAITVADAEGLAGMSMRRVAAELGVGAMSLYRYVPGKAELLDLMLDRVSGPTDEIKRAAGQGWRAALTAVAWDTRRLYLAHSWLLGVNWSRPTFGPNTLAGFEMEVSALAGLGLTNRERIAVIVALDSYVTGSVRQEVLYAAAPAETGISDEEFWSHQYPIMERAIETGNYPAVASLDEDAFSDSWEDTFEFGLVRLLDGLAQLIESRHSAD